MFPLLHPYGHVAFQAGRGDVHSVMVDGRLVKHNHRLQGIDLAKAKEAVGKTVEYARSRMGEQAWHEAMNPEKPTVERIDNPYTYTDWDGGRAAWKQPRPSPATPAHDQHE